MKTSHAIAKKIVKSMDEESVKEFSILNADDKVNFIKNKVNKEILQNADIDSYYLKLYYVNNASFDDIKYQANSFQRFIDNLEKEAEINRELFNTYKYEWIQDYHDKMSVRLNVTGSRLEKNNEYNIRVREIIEEVKSLLNIDGSSKKYKEDIDRKERKYQHYLEMKKWVEESGLNL